MAALVPGEGDKGICGGKDGGGARRTAGAEGLDGDDEAAEGGCGSANGRSSGGEMADMERKLREDEAAANQGVEVEITDAGIRDHIAHTHTTNPTPATDKPHDQNPQLRSPSTSISISSKTTTTNQNPRQKGHSNAPRKLPPKQQMGQCQRCGYLSSQAVCKACMLLEGLNRNRPRRGIEVGEDKGQKGRMVGERDKEKERSDELRRAVEGLVV